MYETRKFAIFSTTEINKIDFSQVLETSAETLRLSTDGTKTFVKWDEGIYDPTPYEEVNIYTGETTLITPEPPHPPEFISTLETLEGPYTYSQILEVLSTPEWSVAENGEI